MPPGTLLNRLNSHEFADSRQILRHNHQADIWGSHSMSRHLLNVVQSNYKFSADVQVLFCFFWLNVFTKEKLQIVKTKKKLIIKQEMGLFVFSNLLCVAGLTDKVTGGDADM